MKILITILILLTEINIIPAQVTEEWVARYNGSGNISEFASALAVDKEGNVYVTGESDGGPWEDYTTVKYNSNGEEQWVVDFNGGGNDSPNDIAVDNDGNVYITGSSEGVGTGDDYATVKYNSSGVQQWVARYNGTGNSSDDAKSIVIDSQGNVYVTGVSSESGTGNDGTTIKYNTNGDSLWVVRYNGLGNGNDNLYAIKVDSEGRK